MSVCFSIPESVFLPVLARQISDDVQGELRNVVIDFVTVGRLPSAVVCLNNRAAVLPAASTDGILVSTAGITVTNPSRTVLKDGDEFITNPVIENIEEIRVNLRVMTFLMAVHLCPEIIVDPRLLVIDFPKGKKKFINSTEYTREYDTPEQIMTIMKITKREDGFIVIVHASIAENEVRRGIVILCKKIGSHLLAIASTDLLPEISPIMIGVDEKTQQFVIPDVKIREGIFMHGKGTQDAVDAMKRLVAKIENNCIDDLVIQFPDDEDLEDALEYSAEKPNAWMIKHGAFSHMSPVIVEEEALYEVVRNVALRKEIVDEFNFTFIRNGVEHNNGRLLVRCEGEFCTFLCAVDSTSEVMLDGEVRFLTSMSLHGLLETLFSVSHTFTRDFFVTEKMLAISRATNEQALKDAIIGVLTECILFMRDCEVSVAPFAEYTIRRMYRLFWNRRRPDSSRIKPSATMSLLASPGIVLQLRAFFPMFNNHRAIPPRVVARMAHIIANSSCKPLPKRAQVINDDCDECSRRHDLMLRFALAFKNRQKFDSFADDVSACMSDCSHQIVQYSYEEPIRKFGESIEALIGIY